MARSISLAGFFPWKPYGCQNSRAHLVNRLRWVACQAIRAALDRRSRAAPWWIGGRLPAVSLRLGLGFVHVLYDRLQGRIYALGAPCSDDLGLRGASAVRIRLSGAPDLTEHAPTQGCVMILHHRISKSSLPSGSWPPGLGLRSGENPLRRAGHQKADHNYRFLCQS